MLRLLLRRVTLTLHFRYHNAKVGEECRKDFRRLSERVANETVTGEEQYRHMFRRLTPADVLGAVPQVEVGV